MKETGTRQLHAVPELAPGDPVGAPAWGGGGLGMPYFDLGGRSRRFTETKLRAAAAVCHRRRGSVLVLVMTLLGILFVTGIAFLATMSFESEMVRIERSRDRNNQGIESVLNDTSSALRDGIVGDSGAPFGGVLDEPFMPLGTEEFGATSAVLGEMPGVHDWFSPIEPYFDPDVVVPDQFRFRWFTDLRSVTGQGDESFDATRRRRENMGEVSAGWPSGVAIEYVNPDGDLEPLYPVDSDGDGVTDTFQFDVTELGFSDTQIAGLAQQLNPSTNPNGKVFLGMRVIAHGGLVNLNESHPSLIANVLDISTDALFLCGSDPDLTYFVHGPTAAAMTVCPDLSAHAYSPQLEEPLLRRRGFLAPRIVPPSLLHGNRLADPSASGQEFGGADMPTKLYPANADGVFGTVFDGAHQYAMFDGLEQNYSDDAKLWPVRMEPFTSIDADDTGNAYDRRHLITTVSYDDLLSRGGRVVSAYDIDGVPSADVELREAMMAVNREDCESFPFEYVDYPQDMLPGGCECLEDPDCALNARKGRLQLSLAFLDKEFPCEELLAVADGSGGRQEEVDTWKACEAARTRLIYDAFMMLVRNAHGAYWDEIEDCGTSGCPEGEFCDLGLVPSRCVDPDTGLSHRQSRLSRTAAALTANLIDFMDAEDRNADLVDDGIPTRVALRSFDFEDRTCVNFASGLSSTPDPCQSDDDCPGSDSCLSTAGWELGSLERLPNNPSQFVYGLERQPYITEVVTAVDDSDPPLITNWAVEIYNPYDEDIRARDGSVSELDQYWLVPLEPGIIWDPTSFPRSEDVLIPADPTVVRAESFTVIYSGSASELGYLGSLGDLFKENASNLRFENGWTIYLVRRLVLPYETETTTIVVDQFKVGSPGDWIGTEDAALGTWIETQAIGPNQNLFALSAERFLRDPDPTATDPFSQWTATVPHVVAEAKIGHTLGTWNSRNDDPQPQPVEVNFANTGTFTFPVPNSLDVGVAFPTTGSMLLLMRHANRPIEDVTAPLGPTLPAEPVAFTSKLAETVFLRIEEQPLGSGIFVQAGFRIREIDQVDNGRMPVFDTVVFEDPAEPQKGRQFAHHMDPATGACCLPNTLCFNGLIVECDNQQGTFWLGKRCSPDVCEFGGSAPGGLVHLPWGQLLWDYFTVLPLSSPGPYTRPADVPVFEYMPAQPDSIPRVDLDGLRVHGRININAAPWKVLAGLPLTPMEKIPEPFRTTIREVHDLTIAQDPIAARFSDQLALAVVAYRDAREIQFPPVAPVDTTGNFGNEIAGVPGWRGWEQTSPMARRGTGFLAVGELANVRHPGATTDLLRIDSGAIDGDSDTPDDYIRAVAVLVSLGDWVTTRSHVFTTYGTLRGDIDESITDPDVVAEAVLRAIDVDKRAIRFQETVDRLPTFLGVPAPIRIGQRVVGPYIDVLND